MSSKLLRKVPCSLTQGVHIELKGLSSCAKECGAKTAVVLCV